MEKLTIYQLTKYYVGRYGLPTDNRAGTAANAEDGMQAYHRYFERLLVNTRIGEISLYDAMVPAGGGARAITLEEFERFCLQRLAGYIQKRYPKEHNESVLMADLEKWHYQHDKAFWESKAEEARKNQLEAMANGQYNPPMEDDGTLVISDEEVAEKGHWMMVEALYDALFDGFAWDKLRADMEAAALTPEEASQADFTGDMMRSRERLKSYLNYVGKRKE